MVPLTLAVATDALLKNEFDSFRGSDAVHPLWAQYGLDVSAYDHPDIDLWRSNFKGIRIRYGDGVEVFGAVDDIWKNRQTGELHIVDYKSTSKKDVPTLDGGFGDGYKRQMEIYQWLFRKCGFPVSSTGYFLYVNGKKDQRFYRESLNGIMTFDTTLIPYEADDSWVEGVIQSAIATLSQDAIPERSGTCDNCRYYEERSRLELHVN